MRTIESAKDPVYADAANTLIKLTVKFVELDREVPFLANAKDSEPWGRQIHADATAGKYGAIAAYVAPPVDPAIAQAEAAKKATRDSAIAKLKALGLTEEEALSLI
jgi:hypothetical protein